MTEDNGKQEKQIVTTATVALAPQIDKQRVLAAAREFKKLLPNGSKLSDDAALTLANISLIYELNPLEGEVWYLIRPNGEPIGVMVGIKGRRKKARQQSPFQTEYQFLDQQEQQAIGFEDGDVAIKCLLFRLDLGRQFNTAVRPFVGYGIVKKQENFPPTWNRLSRAKKRAEVDAIKQAYDLRLPHEVSSIPRDAVMVGLTEDDPDGRMARQHQLYYGSEDGQEEEPDEEAGAGHWMDSDRNRATFWAQTREWGLKHDEVQAALGVESVKDFQGSMNDALAIVEAVAHSKADAVAAQGSML